MGKLKVVMIALLLSGCTAMDEEPLVVKCGGLCVEAETCEIFCEVEGRATQEIEVYKP